MKSTVSIFARAALVAIALPAAAQIPRLISYQGSLAGISTEAQLSDPFLSNAGTTSTPNDHWQSFSPQQSGQLLSVKVRYQQGDPAITFRVYSGEGTGGALLATQAANLSVGWNTIALAAPVPVAVSQKYTFRISAASEVRLYHSNSNAYAGGTSSLCCGYDLAFEAATRYPLPNTTAAMTFRLYAVSTGGTALFTESQGSVPVVDGIFNAVIGSVTPIPSSVAFDVPYFLGVTVAPDASEMTPRRAVTATPYALRASVADRAAAFAAPSAEVQSAGPFLSNAGTTSTPNDHWQSFTPRVSGELLSVKVNYQQGASGVTLGVYSGEGVGGTLLTSQAATLAVGWNTIAFVSPTPVLMNQKYTFRVSAGSEVRLYHSNSDAYVNGISSLCCGYDLAFEALTMPKLVVASPNNTCWALRVSDAGAVSATPTPCPSN